MKLRGKVVNVFLSVLLVFSPLLGQASWYDSDCGGGYVDRQGRIIMRDPGDVFPWGLELPFPWRGIQGVWTAGVDGQQVYLSFRTVKAGNLGNQLRIIMYNPTNCNIVATGAGFEEDRVVTAVMTGAQGSFSMTVHVFKESDMRLMSKKVSPDAKQADNNKTVTVLKVSSSDNVVGPDVAYELTKISGDYNSICRPNY